MQALVAGVLALLTAFVPLQGVAAEREPADRTVARSQNKFPNAKGDSKKHGDGPLRKFIVEVERATHIRPNRFGEWVEKVLFDDRSWVGSGRVTLKRIHRGPHAFKVTLATRDTTDRLCAPLPTNGLYSCYMNGRAVINVWRWRNGARSYGKQIERYRRYVINHEVGHALGQGHRSCTGEGDPAPVMVQQTKSLYGCTRNPWPLRFERRTLSP